MHLLTRVASIVGLVTIAVAGSATVSHGVYAAPATIGHVYVNDNTAGINTIGVFDRHADGSLTATSGSPFVAGGSGTGAGIGSQGSLQISSDGKYLLAADAGSNQISVLRIQSDGSVRPVSGSPVSSSGNTPVSISVYRNLVYVANQGDVPNLTGFTLNSGGHLQPLSGSTVTLPTGSNPGDVLFNGTGTILVATLVGHDTGATPIDGKIASFTVGSNGLLIAASESPFPAQANGPFGSEFRPTDPSQLFVSNAHGGSGAGSVSAFSVGGDGALNPISGSPYADNQTAPCWVEISHDGQYLFTVNTGSKTISSYLINADGSLQLPSTTSAALNSPAAGPEDARLDPSGNHLYVVDTGSGSVSAFSVSGGTVTELGSSPVSLPTGIHPFGIVVI